MDGMHVVDGLEGIARNTSGFDVGLAGGLGPVLVAVLTLLAGLLAVAVAAEVLRRGGRAVGLVRGLDRVLPLPARRVAAVAVSLAVGVLGPAHAFASDAPVRDWLAGSTTTTTVAAPLTTGPVATEDRLAARAATTTTATLPTVSPREPVAPPSYPRR